MKLLNFRLFKSLSAILESTKETKCISPAKNLTSLVMSQTLKLSSYSWDWKGSKFGFVV